MVRHLILLLSGVPQGSVIEPLLFLIHIVMILPLSVGRQLTVYADKTLQYRPISCQRDFAALQENINKLYVWVNTNYLQFNTCIFSRKTNKKNQALRLHSLLCRVTILSVLSVSNTWYIYHQTFPGLPILSLYAGRQGNRWDYCAENTIKNINTLEDVQKFALQALGAGLLPTAPAI